MTPFEIACVGAGAGFVGGIVGTFAMCWLIGIVGRKSHSALDR